ncbi:MAG: protease complex subunit PrcB family protein [Thermotogae bacterium]|nr:protease complex subunit PrcB family protein [Thermotogota bacterium]
MDIKIIILGVVTVIAALTGFLFFNLNQKESVAAGMEEKQIELSLADNDYNFKNYQVEDAVKLDFVKIDEAFKQDEAGFKVLENDGFPLVYISAGVKKTGGYSLSVSSVELVGNLLRVYAVLKEPGDEMVTQAFTYPSAVIKINEKLSVGKYDVEVLIISGNTKFLLEKYPGNFMVD